MTINSLIKIFADDTKVFKAISTIQDAEDLQADIDRLALWAKTWQLPYNELKCKTIHYGKNNIKHNYKMNGYDLMTDLEEKDLGVTFDANLSFQPHIGNIISKANGRVGIIKRTFNKLNEENFKILYKSLVRPILEYCTPIWFPLNKREAEEIEKVQRRATKLVNKVRNKTYEDRTENLDLTTLYYRRKRTDMIQTFKIFHGLDDLNSSQFFKTDPKSKTRGHKFKIVKKSVSTKLRQNSFSVRVENDWNKLPHTVVNAKSVNSFKYRLEEFWKIYPPTLPWPLLVISYSND